MQGGWEVWGRNWVVATEEQEEKKEEEEEEETVAVSLGCYLLALL